MRVNLHNAKKDFLTDFTNGAPTWSHKMCTYCLNFNGRVTRSSVKNFQLLRDDNDDDDEDNGELESERSDEKIARIARNAALLRERQIRRKRKLYAEKWILQFGKIGDDDLIAFDWVDARGEIEKPLVKRRVPKQLQEILEDLGLQEHKITQE